MKAKKLMEKARELAGALLEKQGRLIAMVYIHDKKIGIIGVPYKVDKRMPLALEQAVIVCAVKASRAMGNLDGVLLASEAWMSKAPKGHKKGESFSPAKDQNRREVVMLSTYGNDGTRELEIYDLKRTGEKASLGNIVDRGSDSKCGTSWLDEAFEDVEEKKPCRR